MCYVSIQELHLLADYITFSATRLCEAQFKDSFKIVRQMQPLFHKFEGCTICVLGVPAYPRKHYGLAFSPEERME